MNIAYTPEIVQNHQFNIIITYEENNECSFELNGTCEKILLTNIIFEFKTFIISTTRLSKLNECFCE